MKPTTTEEYIARFPADQQKNLIQLLNLVREVLPDTDEVLKWGAPAAVDKDGMILLVFSGHKQHMNFVVTPSTKQAFSEELSDYVTGKGSIQLAYDKPLPVALLTRMMRFRATEYRKHNVNWK